MCKLILNFMVGFKQTPITVSVDGRILDKMELSTDYSIGLASKKRYEIDDTCKKLVIVDNRSNMSVSARLLNKPVVAFQVIITPEGTLQMSALERKLELY